MFRRFAIAVVLIFALAPSAARAAFPAPKGYVSDFAKVISPDVRNRVNAMLAQFERQTGAEVAVVTLPTLEERPIEDVAVELFEQWGIGKKGQDNGVLFLIAPNERRTRIEVGYGLEGAINDAMAGRILDEAVMPHFRAGKMSEGIAAGAIMIVGVVSKREGMGFDPMASYGAGAQQIMAPPGDEGGPLSVILKIAILIVMIIVFIRHPWLFLFFLSTMGRGGGGGGGFSGGFGGFGGGLSGGGGASRGW